MSTLSDLIAQRDALNAQIALFAGFPEDSYNLGTVALFAYQSNTQHIYYRKTGEELWKPIASPATGGKPLSDWIFGFKTSFPSENFEVYIMAPGNTPIYATA